MAINVQGQLDRPSVAEPQSPQNLYLACLTKVDQNPEDLSWFLLFDMIPAEAAVLALATPSSRWPLLPTILLHATDSPDDVVRRVLRPGPDGPMEGSWYRLSLAPGGDPTQVLVGGLYPPAQEFEEDSSGDTWTPRYGDWQIVAWNLLWIPQVQGTDVILVRPPGFSSPGETWAKTEYLEEVQGTKRSNVAIDDIALGGGATAPRAKRARVGPANVYVPPVLPPAPPPPGFGALGVMNVGQGSCNLFLDRALEPVVYFDVGYPLGFFRNSLPANMRADQPVGFHGPIYNNAANDLGVVLSHWDWDHWRLGAVPHGPDSLTLRNWLYPVQPMSPTARNFVNHQIVGVQTQVPPGALPQVLGSPPGHLHPYTFTVYKYVPPGGAFGGMLINNSGLGLRADVDLAVGPSRSILLTGDGNFTYLPLAARNGLTGIGAVHHGSNAHGAAANLPVVPAAAPRGYIAYSYGVNPVSGVHNYGFPVAAAVGNYQGARWGGDPALPTEMGTAEGGHLNSVPPIHNLAQGNIRIGTQGALIPYAHTAFAAVMHPMP